MEMKFSFEGVLKNFLSNHYEDSSTNEGYLGQMTISLMTRIIKSLEDYNSYEDFNVDC